MLWLSELATAAAKTGRAHFRDYATLKLMAIGGQVQQRAISHLKSKCESLEKKLADKVELSMHELSDRVIAGIDAHVAKKLESAVAAIELRFKQEVGWEDTLTRRIGALAKTVADLEARLREQEQRNG